MAKKIMFCDKYGLTKAVLEGRKTQTRRLLKHQPSSEDSEMLFYVFDDERYYDNPEKDPLWGSVSWKNPDGTKTDINKVAYLIGEEVAVAQNYKDAGCDFYFHRGLAGWNNKMFVRSEEMPHRIRITNVRLERLQDISDEDCLKEGIEQCGTPTCHKHYCTRDCGDCAPSPREAFAILIDKTCGKGTWESNPYVFVYDFELIR